VAVEVAGLLVANGFFFGLGGAIFVTVGWVDRRPSTWPRLGAAYLFGIATIVVPASYAALAGYPVGWGTIALALVVCFWLARRRLRRDGVRDERSAARVPGQALRDAAAAVPFLVAVAVLLVFASRTFAVRPLVEWDSWALWAVKARLLYEAPAAAPDALLSANYGQPTYPLVVPELEALGFRAFGEYDGTLIGVQFLLLALAFVSALLSVLSGVARPPMVAIATASIVAAPQFLYQLVTHYADVPLGIFVGAGVAAGGAWLADHAAAGWRLVAAAVFLATAGLVKNEGLLFAVAAVVALTAAAALTSRVHVLRALAAAAVVLAVDLPWRVYVAARGLRESDYDLTNLVRPDYLSAHADRLRPAAAELWLQISAPNRWGYVVPAVLLALGSGVLAGRWRVCLYAALWLVLAFVGLLATYWISVLPLSTNLTNSSFRTIVSLIVGALALTPLLLLPPADDGL
jgi:hypothetical protein